VLIVVVAIGAVLLFLYEKGQQQQDTWPPISQAPVEVVSRPAREPLPSAPAPQPTPGPGFVLEPEASKVKPSVIRPKTGTNIWTPVGASGHGTLRIHNGTSYDGAVTLLDQETGTVPRFVYIRAREVTTLSAIAPCQCRLFFALGTDWNSFAEEFGENSSFSVFDDPLRFNEAKTEEGVRWATFDVTLHPIPKGKAKTTRLSKEEFERQLGKPHTHRASN